MSMVAVPWARDIRTCRQNNSSCDSQLGRGVLSRMRALHGEIWRAKMWETGKHESASGSHAHTHNARAPLIRDTESRPSMRKNIGIKNMSWIGWVRRTNGVRQQCARRPGENEEMLSVASVKFDVWRHDDLSHRYPILWYNFELKFHTSVRVCADHGIKLYVLMRYVWMVWIENKQSHN